MNPAQCLSCQNNRTASASASSCVLILCFTIVYNQSAIAVYC